MGLFPVPSPDPRPPRGTGLIQVDSGWSRLVQVAPGWFRLVQGGSGHGNRLVKLPIHSLKDLVHGFADDGESVVFQSHHGLRGVRGIPDDLGHPF